MSVPRRWLMALAFSGPALFVGAFFAGRFTAVPRPIAGPPAPSAPEGPEGLATFEPPPSGPPAPRAPEGPEGLAAFEPPPSAAEPEGTRAARVRAVAREAPEGADARRDRGSSGRARPSRELAAPSGPSTVGAERPPEARTGASEGSGPLSLGLGRPPRGRYGLQISAHPSREEAEAFLSVHEAGLEGPVHLVERRIQGRSWYRIRVGAYESASAARQARTRLPAPLQPGSMVVRYR